MKKCFVFIFLINFGCALNIATKINFTKAEPDYFKDMKEPNKIYGS